MFLMLCDKFKKCKHDKLERQHTTAHNNKKKKKEKKEANDCLNKTGICESHLKNFQLKKKIGSCIA